MIEVQLPDHPLFFIRTLFYCLKIVGLAATLLKVEMIAIEALVALLAASGAVTAQQIVRDPVAAGPPLELVHLYYDEWPTGKAVCFYHRFTRITLL